MAVTIFFDGLNQIGYSIAMALELEKKSFQRIGFAGREKGRVH
jgi:hypothetical protein